MTDLLFSPLTDAEVYERGQQSDHNIASGVRQDRHREGSYFHEYFVRDVEENRTLAAARDQRLFRHPDGIAGVVEARRAEGGAP